MDFKKLVKKLKNMFKNLVPQGTNDDKDEASIEKNNSRPKNKKSKRSDESSTKDKDKKKVLYIVNPPPASKNPFFYMMLIFLAFLFYVGMANEPPSENQQISINKVIEYINEEKVQNITVVRDDIEIQLKDGTKLYSKKESLITFDEILANNNVDISKISGELKVEDRIFLSDILPTLLSFAIPLIILIYIFRQMKSGGSDLFSFGKSRAKMFNKESPKVTFDDVAGVEEAKKEMEEIVDFLKHPKKYRKLGARIPKGVLLVGPAGVGKTLLAKAIAGEAEVPFFSVAGSEFMEMLVGVGSSRVRDLFAKARQAQPSLIFIDEIDAIGRQRGMGIGGGHDEREQTLNQILIEMDGFDPRTNVIVIAATNRPDMLDPALVRAGRFDRRITLDLPDLQDRKEIIKIHMRGKPFDNDFNLEKVAKKTVGFSGADIENMLNEAAILAARENAEKINMKHIDEAALKVTMGPERRRLQDEHDKKVTAYHEAGHALVGAKVEGLDPVARVTIVPRGGSLGHTSLPPEKDRYNETKTRLESMLAMMLGGRAAEELIFNEVTTGAASDIEKATNLARKMVTEWGMSSLGPIAYDGSEGSRIWLAKQMGEMPHFSQEIAAKIDLEIKKFIDNAYDKAKKILKENRSVLDKVVEVLLEKETIDGDEFYNLIS